MKIGFHTNTNTTPTKLNFHYKEPQCWSNNNINIKDNNKGKNKININNDNKKALFRKKLINLLIISCILLLALCFNSPTSCIQIVSAFQHFVTNNITKNHRRGVTKRSQRITTTRGGGGCKNVFVWLLKAIIVTLGKAQRFFITFLKFLKLWDIFLQVLSSVFVLDKCHFYQRSYWWNSFLSWFFLIVFCSCDLLFDFE